SLRPMLPLTGYSKRTGAKEKRISGSPTRPALAGLVPRSINPTTFAARDFWPRRGASDEHTLQGSVRSEQRRLGQKEPPPGGLRRIWLLALLLLGHRALAAMLPRRASPEAKCGATNVVVFT